MPEIFRTADTALHVSDMGGGVIRVRACAGASRPAYRSFAVLPDISETPFAQKAEENGVTTLRTEDGLRVEVAPDLAVTVWDADGRMIHRDLSERAYREDASRRFTHSFALDGFRHIYGLGERTGAFNRYRRHYRLDMRDAAGYDAELTDPLYKQILFMVRRDLEQNLWSGLFYDVTCGGEIDLGREHSGYWPRYCKVSLVSDQIDYYVIAGRSMKEIIRKYCRLTGTTAMPPLAAMGHMASTMYLTELDRDADRAIEDFIGEFHRRGFGCDGYHMSSGYTSIGGKRYVFHWNTDRFPDPDRFNHALTDRGLLLSPNIKPAMLTDHPLYEAFRKAGAFLKDSRTGEPYVMRWWGGKGSFVDLLGEAGQREWKKCLKAQLLERGVNALWDDNNEYELDDDCAVTDGDSRPASALRPAFSNEMARLSVEAIRETLPDTRPYVLTRSGYAGIQRYAQTWAGDNLTEWKALRWNVPIMLGMSVSGVANQGCDIGGFAGPAPDGELFVRWVQNGIFQPRFCLHSCNDDNTITQPWTYEEYTPIIREAFRLRYRLALYLYSLMHEAHRTGDPVMRPMAFEFDDACLADEGFDFMEGPYLLVASVLDQGAETRSVYLPAGYDWIEWDTGRRHAGGQTVTVDAPLERIPLFRRSGSIVPLADDTLRLTAEAFRHVTLLVDMTCDTAFTLYQDDGVSNRFEQGDCLETAITLKTEPARVTLAFTRTGEGRDHIEAYDLRLGGRFPAPQAVLADGAAVRQVLSREDFDAAEGAAWYFSLQRREVLLRLANIGHDFDIVLDYGIHDLIGM